MAALQMKRTVLGIVIVIAAMVAIPVSVAVYSDPETRAKVLGGVGLKDDMSQEQTFDTQAIARQIHELVNEERAKVGVRPLTYDERLENVAYLHSEDMATKDYFAHESPDGNDLRDRLRVVGVACAVASENLILGGPQYGQNDSDVIAQSALNGWMESSDHRENILRSNLSREGIGIAFNENRQIAYITQNFC